MKYEAWRLQSPKRKSLVFREMRRLCLEKETPKDSTCDLQQLHVKPVKDNPMYSNVQYIPQSRTINYQDS